MRDDMGKRFGEADACISAMDVRINERINETNEHIAAMDSQLNSKIDSNLKWMLGVQIAMWVTIIVAVLKASTFA